MQLIRKKCLNVAGVIPANVMGLDGRICLSKSLPEEILQENTGPGILLMEDVRIEFLQ